MLPNLFAPTFIIIAGIACGFILGFLFQKGQLSQFKVIVGQFLFTNFTVLKVIMTAIIVGSVGIHLMLYMELPLKIDIYPFSILAVTIGGILFGIGMVVLGYCPGTCIAAAGQGSNDAWFGLLGMIFGGWIYAEIDPIVHTHIKSMWKTEMTELPKILQISPWMIILALVIISIILFKFLGRKKIAQK